MRHRHFILLLMLFGSSLSLASCKQQAPSNESVAPQQEAPPSRADATRASTLSVDGMRIRDADGEPDNWLAHGRGYDEQRFSPLREIDRTNVASISVSSGLLTENDPYGNSRLSARANGLPGGVTALRVDRLLAHRWLDSDLLRCNYARPVR